MTILEKLQKIQVELKVSKSQVNAFGKYKYRSAEDVLESIKPFQAKYNVVFKITDELKELAGHVYVNSEAKIIDTESTDRESSISSTAQAIIDFNAKGMQNPQKTGSASSYAKKYALGNLLLIDESALDPDASNTHGKAPQKASKPTLKIGSPEYNKVVSFMAKGGEFSKVALKYTIPADVEKQLKQ